MSQLQNQSQTEYAGSLSDLLAPLGDAPAVEKAPAKASAAPVPAVLPELDELLGCIAEVVPAQSYGVLPKRVQIPAGAPENLSGLLRSNGHGVSEALRNALGQYIRTEADLRWCLRVLAAHALNIAIGNRHRTLIEQETSKARTAKQYDTSEVVAAAMGEAVALEASKMLSPAEFELVMQHVRDGHVRIAQNLAGADIDIPALAAGHGKDWRALASEWAEKVGARSTATFSVPTGARAAVSGDAAAGSVSYVLEVQPGEGWVLSQWNDSVWTPVQASADATDRAGAARAAVSATRRSAAKPVLPILGVFRDELGRFA
ncbi:hypothetical protein P3W53_25490 [Pseudomonas denitrificans (nom. rej.)]|nr:hypothetical protein [Pseudomonas denitrificans (nom. rej.)]